METALRVVVRSDTVLCVVAGSEAVAWEVARLETVPVETTGMLILAPEEYMRVKPKYSLRSSEFEVKTTYSRLTVEYR